MISRSKRRGFLRFSLKLRLPAGLLARASSNLVPGMKFAAFCACCAAQSIWLDTDTSKCLWNNDNQSHPAFQ
jgi:hypothetical protein